MIPCRFIFRFKGGGSSDSLNRLFNVHSVPRVGETISMIGVEGNIAESVVLEVAHHIDPTKDSHEVVVYYGSAKA